MIVAVASVTFASGALALGYAAIALYFARFWRDTGDRFFALFSLAFAIFAADRVLLVLERARGTTSVDAFAIRLAAFAVILLAILDKNRAR